MFKMDNIIVKVSDFSITPGPRFRNEGRYSGEEFREDILERQFLDAVKNNSRLIVDLDGTLGYGTSFLEEVFGGLARKHGEDKLNLVLKIISNEEPYLVDNILSYIENSTRIKN